MKKYLLALLFTILTWIALDFIHSLKHYDKLGLFGGLLGLLLGASAVILSIITISIGKYKTTFYLYSTSLSLSFAILLNNKLDMVIMVGIPVLFGTVQLILHIGEIKKQKKGT